MNPVKCTRIFTDTDGESHVDEVAIELQSVDFARHGAARIRP